MADLTIAVSPFTETATPEVGQHAIDAFGGVGQPPRPRFLIESKAVLVWSTAADPGFGARLLLIRLVQLLLNRPRQGR